MKQFTAIIFIMFSMATSYSQSSKLELKNGDVKEVQIVAHSSTDLFVEDGQIEYSEISKAYFMDSLANSERLYKALRKSGVIVVFGEGVSVDEKLEAELPMMLINPVSNEKNLMSLDLRLESFRKDRTTAKAVQLIGILAIGGSVFLQAIYNRQYEEDLDRFIQNSSGSLPEPKYVPPFIPATGLGLMTIGITLDLGAGDRLRKGK